LKNFLVGRGLSAVASLFLVAAANPASAAPVQAPAVSAAAVVAAPVVRAAVTINRVTSAVAAPVAGNSVQRPPAAPAAVPQAPSVAREAAWLKQNGWPLYALVDRFSAGAPLDEQANCIAVAVYHEARGETLEGQLAVARVIMNRAASGRYPSSWCGVVKQPSQFSFVRNGYMPSVDQGSKAWSNALGVTRLAINDAVQSVPDECLWYHANYVSPSWGRRLVRVSQIGAHIFYRA